MKIGKLGLVWLFLLTIAFVCKVSPVNAPNGLPSELTENIMTNVNCTTAKVSITSMVMSSDPTLVHFPSGVDMNNPNLENVITLGLMFFSSPGQSVLIYEFNNTDEATAKSIADGITPTINTAFQTAFTWFSTGPSNGYVNVTYTEPGKADLVAYVSWLKDQCLVSDIGGFSLTFVPMVQVGAFFGVVAQKASGGFDWNYMTMASRTTDIPTGSNSHTIDFLELLNVNSLEPSPYSAEAGLYTSMVVLLVNSDQTVSYERCEPGLATSPGERGWILSPLPPSNTLTAYFTFGDDSTPVAPLTFTFSGVVVSEFTTLTPIALVILASAAVFIAKRRFQKI